MKITAAQIRGEDLKPGDLFSMKGPEYWCYRRPGSIGERVYIRTTKPLPAGEEDTPLYLITIEWGDS